MPSPFAHRALRSVLMGCSTLALASAAAAQDTVALDTVVVEGQGGSGNEGSSDTGGLTADGYVAKDARVGTKTDTDLRKVPQAVAAVSKKELEDRQVQTLTEAARYTAGVRAGTYGFDPSFDTIFIRGFDVTYSGFYRDGLRSLGGSFATFRHEPYGLEGVTILKGPSSSLYGSAAPGGLVNVISKRPTEAPFRELEFQVGSHDRAQVNFDASGPLGGNDNVLYRITGIKRSADTEFVAARDDRTYIAPALTLRSDDRDTHLTVLGEYSDLKAGGARGFLTLTNPLNGQAFITDIEQGDPRYRDLDQEQARIGYEFEHRFNENLAVRQNLRFQSISTDMKYVSVYGLNPDGISAYRGTGQILDNADGIAVDNQIEGRFQTGEIAHTVLGGLDYTYFDGQYRYGGGLAPDLNLITRNYGQQPVDPVTSNSVINSDTHQQQVGLYVQDQAEYQRFVLTGGLRYDWLDTDTLNNVTPSSSQRAEDRHLSGRVGVSYLFDNGVTPYANYATSFAPTLGVGADGSAFDPTTGEQIEVGVKYAPEGLGFTVDAALFQIKQDNILSAYDALGFQRQEGAVKSQGFEIETKASLTDGLSLVAAYTYLDLSYDGGENDGNLVVGQPHHQFSLWGNYEFLSGPAQGLELGLGSRFIGKTYADNANTYENEARVLIDASIGYDFGAADPRLEGVKAQFNAKNVFDDRKALCNSGYCYREEGRSLIGSLRYRF
ncbi:TonB-dependent siderophore receptor [Aureimonas sp. ME7]|uniref:TonB-dependent siderophore receptor n=1 Tax=Aureimonas sp. ME7 TaxID=2744252 RepID=UPI0015F71259|nr:TonB-dependent siderophore receptor [Aureimonas sp. ME7]